MMLSMDLAVGSSAAYIKEDLPARPFLALGEIWEFLTDRAIQHRLGLKARVVVPVPSTLA